MNYQNIKEEEFKNRIAKDFVWLYDCARIIGNVDFCVCMQEEETHSLLWAEAKKGRMNSTSTDEKYNELKNNLNGALQILANQIEPKIYAYGFLIE